MLKIRPEQYEILRESYRERYVQRTRDRLRREWPEECAGLEEPQLEELVRRARDKAESYGLEVEGDVWLFTESWLLIGDDFDESPEYPWARQILQDDQMNGTAKAAAVRHRTLQLLEEIAGEGGPG